MKRKRKPMKTQQLMTLGLLLAVMMAAVVAVPLPTNAAPSHVPNQAMKALGVGHCGTVQTYRGVRVKVCVLRISVLSGMRISLTPNEQLWLPNRTWPLSKNTTSYVWVPLNRYWGFSTQDGEGAATPDGVYFIARWAGLQVYLSNGAKWLW
jgi:hypothetical protein